MSKSKMPLLGWRIELCMHCAVWVVFWLIEEYTVLIQHGSVNSYLSDMLQIEKLKNLFGLVEQVVFWLVEE